MAGQPELPAGTLVVLGLGNPGPRYSATRHNLGFMVVEAFASRLGIGLGKSGFNSRWGEGRQGGRKLVLALPQTFMNLSGQAGRAILDYFGLPPEHLLVVHDDLDLAPGQLKLAVKGSAAGHKGVASLIGSLGSDRFTRLKVGIGRPRYAEAIEEYVLTGFYADQRQEMAEAVTRGAQCLEVALAQGLAQAMQMFHTVAKGSGGGSATADRACERTD